MTHFDCSIDLLLIDRHRHSVNYTPRLSYKCVPTREHIHTVIKNIWENFIMNKEIHKGPGAK
jgi:hypothetical protein